MENKFTQVFRVDINTREYAAHDVYIGAESPEDLLNHFNEIFPPNYHTIHREDWMDDEDWGEECEWGAYKEGDVIEEPYFDEDIKKLIQESLDTNWSRIKKIDNLYTDKPYCILDTFGYEE